MKLRFLMTVLLVFVLLMSVNTTVSGATGAGPIDLGTLGGTFSLAVDVNNLNQVIGVSTLLGDEILHGFIWEDGTMTDLGTLGGDITEAVSINNNGQIVGNSETVPGGPRHAFLWESGVMADLGTFGGLESSAVDINDQGQILVMTVIPTGPAFIVHCFIFDGENLTTIGGFDTVYAINENGQVVGRMNNHAAIWDNGTVIDLGTLGGPASIAFDISNSGFVVGQSYGDGVDFFDHGFVWKNGIMSDLGTLGGETSEARGVSEDGTVVGWSVTEDGMNMPFIWNQGVMDQLETLGGTEGTAGSINENGMVVGFSALPENSESHATLWVIPEITLPPVAIAGLDQTVYAGMTFTLDASASFDPEAGMLTYEWDLDNDGQFDDATGITTVTSFNQVGAYTIGLRVTDDGGLSDTDTTTVTVLPWTLKGFYQPVDMNGVYNTVKGSSTVPLKFEIFAGTTELIDVSYIKSLTYAQTTCDANEITDEIETIATGDTSLRYDVASGQFIYNWKTPKLHGRCLRVTMVTQDGSSLVAYFKLK